MATVMIMRTRVPSARGQATTETILLSWLLILLFAAAYQIFLAHDQMSLALGAVHARVFQMAFDANQSDRDMDCDGAANVLWEAPDIPEATIPTLSIFERFFALKGEKYGLESGIQMRNTPWKEAELAGQPCPTCKRTRICVGTQGGVFSF
jgi:hypothetical protein